MNALLASSLAKGLFNGAVLQSGGLLGNMIPASLKDAETIGIELQKKTGTVSIDELRNKSAEEILKASQLPGIGRMGLTLDGYVLPKDFFNYFKEGKHNNVPLMIGWVTGDATLFGKPTITAEKFIQQVKEKYGDKVKIKVIGNGIIPISISDNSFISSFFVQAIPFIPSTSFR